MRTSFEGAPAIALPLTATEDRQFATLAHFGGVLGCVPALLIYSIYKDRGPFTAQESKEALNFMLPPTILGFVTWLLALVPGVGALFAILSAIGWITLTLVSVRAGIRVNRGQPHRYRFNLRPLRHL
ncbi:DUF4870 domain-containing protein (plasmid) [Arthrobacter sp. Z1-15]